MRVHGLNPDSTTDAHFVLLLPVTLVLDGGDELEFSVCLCLYMCFT